MEGDFCFIGGVNYASYTPFYVMHRRVNSSNFAIDLQEITLHSMKDILYIIAVILVILWAIGFFGFHVGEIIHVLIVIAIIAVLLRVIRGR